MPFGVNHKTGLPGLRHLRRAMETRSKLVRGSTSRSGKVDAPIPTIYRVLIAATSGAKASADMSTITF